MEEKQKNLLEEDYFTEEEVLDFLCIGRATLSGRRSRGTDHPPYIEVGRKRLYPRREFKEWVNKRSVRWSVK